MTQEVAREFEGVVVSWESSQDKILEGGRGLDRDETGKEVW